MHEIDQLQHTIDTLNAQRSILGDAVVETALAPLREKLAQLRRSIVAAGLVAKEA
jgi:hypothetical protein